MPPAVAAVGAALAGIGKAAAVAVGATGFWGGVVATATSSAIVGAATSGISALLSGENVGDSLLEGATLGAATGAVLGGVGQTVLGKKLGLDTMVNTVKEGEGVGVNAGKSAFESSIAESQNKAIAGVTDIATDNAGFSLDYSPVPTSASPEVGSSIFKNAVTDQTTASLAQDQIAKAGQQSAANILANSNKEVAKLYLDSMAKQAGRNMTGQIVAGAATAGIGALSASERAKAEEEQFNKMLNARKSEPSGYIEKGFNVNLRKGWQRPRAPIRRLPSVFAAAGGN